MTVHKALQSQRIGRQPMCQGSGLSDIQSSVNASIQRLNDYIKKRGGRLITATRKNTDDTSINKTKITRKQKWEDIICVNFSSDEEAKSNSRKEGNG